MTALWALAALVLLVLPRRRAPAHRAARTVVGPGSLRATAAAASGGVVAALFVGAPGVGAGVVIAFAVWWSFPVLPARPRDPGGDELVRVPLVLDLVAAVLRTGQPVATAITLGADAAAPQLGHELRRVGALLRLGAAPADAWSALAADSRLRPVALVAVRSADSGIRLAAGWSALATELRAGVAETATARAGRAGTWAIAPLGLCFLPSFVCLGIAPVVVGLSSSLLNGGIP